MSCKSKEAVVNAHCVNLLNTIYPTLRNYPKIEQARLCSFILGSLCTMVSYTAIAEKRSSLRISLEQKINSWLNFASLANIDRQIELLIAKYPFLSYQNNQLKLTKAT